MVDRELNQKNIEQAIANVAGFKLGERLDAVDGREAHQILPEIWPMIQELRLLADACEAGKLQPKF